MANRLIHETSPYLLQHAHNPVDWHPWDAEALRRAREEDKPILVSIGYSACHWCHVMERESFENEDIARTMNYHFINIKVDREERPDLDTIYGDPQREDMTTLLGVVYGRFLPNKVLMGYNPDGPSPHGAWPLPEGRSLREGKATAYVCQRPVTHPQDLEAQLTP